MGSISLSIGFFKSPAVMALIFTFWLPSVSVAHEISAGAAIVMDNESETILFAKNLHKKMLPASTTKLITVMVALEKLDPTTVITISNNAARTPSVTPQLHAGERFTVKDILYLALMRSVNSAAVALAEETAGSEEAFVEVMNEKVKSLGLEGTSFVNASGLPGEGQYITAYDLAKIMEEALKIPLIREAITTRVKEITSVVGRHIFLKNTNKLLWSDEDIIGGKTGYTKAAKHCFVCAAQKGTSTLISVVLGEVDRNMLWKDTAMLLAVSSEAGTKSTYLAVSSVKTSLIIKHKGNFKHI